MPKEKQNSAAGLFIPAGFFLGFGLGFIFDNIPAGIFGGLGLGFFLYAIIENFKKKSK
jgi:hypothetical protein